MPEQFIETTAIQRLCLHDGPGIRTTVFLKGCYLNCPWCCNPETKSSDKIQYYYYPEKCWYNENENKIPEKCCNCKKITILDCPYGVSEAISTKWNIDSLFDKLIQDKDFWGAEGGVTFSGGDPLMQSEALLPLLKKLKAEAIHIIVETSLYAPYSKLEKIEPCVDSFIVDIKVLKKPYIALKYKNEKLEFFDNIHYLSSVNKIDTLRMVLIDKVTTSSENIMQLQELINKIKFNNLEFLEYHTLGNKKAERIGLPTPVFEKPGFEEIKLLLKQFNNAKYLKI
jgi:pyruvate formate lyase activating enzyme